MLLSFSGAALVRSHKTGSLDVPRSICTPRLVSTPSVALHVGHCCDSNSRMYS
jgi:hypothetical protein